MASDVPAFLEVGTPVSAKFKGAFCEATIKSVKKTVKFKVSYKDGSGSTIVNDELIEGDYKLNGLVLIKQDDGESKPASIQKMNDLSLYTVVFDDGDERTLRRTNVCVMGERHFQEHDNLDNLPLTDPENFLSPVVLSADKRRKRRRSVANLEEEDSDSDSKRWTSEQDKEFLGKVICIEQGERKKSWFPALGVKHVATHLESQVFVQSFKDGKRMLVNRDDIKEFSKAKEPLCGYLKGETKTEPILKSAIEKALAYHDMGELPKGWNILDTIDEKEESSDEELPTTPLLSAEAKAFQETVYAFMNKQGSPISKPPLVNNQGINLHKLYELVTEIGGFEELSNQQWRTIYKQLGLRNIHTTASFNMKTIYKRYLLPYEEHVKNAASQNKPIKSKGRRGAAASLKDEMDKASNKSESDSEPERRRLTRGNSRLVNAEKTPELSERKRRSNVTVPLESSNLDDACDKDAKSDSNDGGDVKLSEVDDVDVINSPETSTSSDEPNTTIEKDEGNGKSLNPTLGKYKIGTKIAVHYGTGKNQMTYNAKILDVDKDDHGDIVYYIHYNGWNHRYDEWMQEHRVVALNANTPIKQRKNPNPPSSSLSKIVKDPPQRYKAKVRDAENKSKSSVKPILTSTAASTLAPTPSVIPSPVPATPPTPITPIFTPVPKVPSKLPTTLKSTAALTASPIVSNPAPLINLSSTPINSTTSIAQRLSRFQQSNPQPLTVKCGKFSVQTAEKLPSPIKSPALAPDGVFLTESLKSQNAHHSNKHPHHNRPKPLSDTLFVPDIKPSPVKPRMTRNSMQDTFLQNALEESIGKSNQAAMSLQQDVLSKSEPNLSRRRSNRQNPSPKSDSHTDSDISGSKEDVKDILLTEKEEESPKTGNILMIKEEPVTLPTLEAKESSKEDNVKKWIEDSNMIMSNTDTKNSTEVEVKEELKLLEDTLASDEKSNIKRGRKFKTKSQDSSDTKSEKRRRKAKDDGDESDSENEAKPETVKETTRQVSEEVCDKINNNILTVVKVDEKPHLPSPSEQTSIDALSAFCNIIGNVPKLQSHESIDSNNSSILDKSNEAPTPTTDNLHERRKSRGERLKRRRTHSTNEDDALRSPKEKKEKQLSPPLEYNPDFLSDLDSALVEKSSVDRIAIMQSRLNAMRKLYCKLRQEVASIDRRKRRKLRKQLEVKSKVPSS